MNNNLQNTWEPDKAIHPGRTLFDILEASNMTQKELSDRTGLTTKTINEILKEKNPITPETAIKLASVFGTSIEFWNNLQKNYDEDLVYIASQKKLVEESKLLKNFTCYNVLEKLSFIEKVQGPKNKLEKTKRLINFFGVSSLTLLPEVYGVAYNKVKHKNKQLNKENLAAWLRCGELNAKKSKPARFDKNKLIDSLVYLRNLTLNTDATKLQKDLIDVCETFGVIVTFVPYFKNTFVCGATRWLNDTPLIQLSMRGGRADSLWFNFFHELGHILLHGKKDRFVDYEKTTKPKTEKEIEANNFAKNTLIPENEYIRLMEQIPLNKEKVKIFAKEIGIHPGIVAGRIAHENHKEQNLWPLIEELRVPISFKETQK